MTRNERANFGSKLGVILASAGSAVGLGNIWRFPFETGNHGGAAFILIYLVCVLILGIPIMIAEFLIGRHGLLTKPLKEAMNSAADLPFVPYHYPVQVRVSNSC